MVTLNDVALKAECTPATVSRALKNNPRISKATRERVFDLVLSMNYKGSAAARSLHARKTRRIGLIIPNLQISHYYHDVSLLHDALSREGYGVILGCHNYDPSKDAEIFRSLLENEVDAIIHVPCTRKGASGILRRDQRVLLVEFGLRSETEWAAAVYSDEKACVNESVDHLTRLGHERIAFITGRKEFYNAKVRSDLFMESLGRSNLSSAECNVYQGPASVQWAQDLVHEILDRSRPPTAMIVANSPALIGVLAALKQKGKTIPRDVSLIALSSEDWYGINDPPLTAYEFPYREMGMMAAQIVLERLRPTFDEDIELPVMGFSGRIIMRDSTSRPASVGAKSKHRRL